MWRSAIGINFACTGASQAGKAPAKCSMITPRKRSVEPVTARWMTTGVRGWPSSGMYSQPSRAGWMKSTWIVESCHSRPSASFAMKSAFGP